MNPIAKVQAVAAIMIVALLVMTWAQIAMAAPQVQNQPTVQNEHIKSGFMVPFFHPAGEAQKQVTITAPVMILSADYGVIRQESFYQIKHDRVEAPLFAPFTSTISRIANNQNGGRDVTLVGIGHADEIRAHFQGVHIDKNLEVGTRIFEGEPFARAASEQTALSFTDGRVMPIKADFDRLQLYKDKASYNIVPQRGVYAQITNQMPEQICRQYRADIMPNYTNLLNMGAIPQGTDFMQWCVESGSYLFYTRPEYTPPPTQGNLTPEELEQLTGGRPQPENNPVVYQGHQVPTNAQQPAYSNPAIQPDNLTNAAQANASEYCSEDTYLMLAAGREQNMLGMQATAQATIEPPGNFHDQACYDQYVAEMTGPVAQTFSNVNGQLMPILDRVIQNSPRLQRMGLNTGELSRLTQQQASQQQPQIAANMAQQLAQNACDPYQNVMGDALTAPVPVDALYVPYNHSGTINSTVPNIGQAAVPSTADPNTSNNMRNPRPSLTNPGE